MSLALFRHSPPYTSVCALRRSLLCRGLFSRNNKEKEEKKKQIWAEINKGYFADLHEYRRNRGKRSESHNQLTPSRESKRFPGVTGVSLSGETLSLPPHGVVSLVLVSMRGLGMGMCNQYRAPFEQEFAQEESVKVLELSLLDKALFRLLRGWVQRNLRKTLPPQRHSSLMVCSEGVEQLSDSLEIGNSIAGYAYLVDREGLIRWRAHASPTAGEVRAMIKCTRMLLGASNNSQNKGQR